MSRESVCIQTTSKIITQEYLMRHYFHLVVGSVALVVGLYLMTQSAFAANEPSPIVVRQSVMRAYVATPADIAHARALTRQFYAQPIPTVKTGTWSQPALIRPSAWPQVKHDNPQSLGNGYVIQMVYPKPGVSCAVIREEQAGLILNSGCGVHYPGE
jgi:hypothetical protein